MREAEKNAIYRRNQAEEDAALPRGPAEVSASEQVQVEMKDRLACTTAIIEYGAIAGEQMALPSQLRGDEL